MEDTTEDRMLLLLLGVFWILRRLVDDSRLEFAAAVASSSIMTASISNSMCWLLLTMSDRFWIIT